MPNLKNIIFREFEKKDDKFIAMNKFFISNECDEGLIEFSGYNLTETFIQYSKNNNIYINNKTYIDLVIISNISFSLDETNINNYELINKFIENNSIIEDKIFEDLYFNKDFSKKINIELPEKYGKQIILEDVDIHKKYLFKINFIELNRNISYENKSVSI